jgi:hypothetical protein
VPWSNDPARQLKSCGASGPWPAQRHLWGHAVERAWTCCAGREQSTVGSGWIGHRRSHVLLLSTARAHACDQFRPQQNVKAGSINLFQLLGWSVAVMADGRPLRASRSSACYSESQNITSVIIIIIITIVIPTESTKDRTWHRRAANLLILPTRSNLNNTKNKIWNEASPPHASCNSNTNN